MQILNRVPFEVELWWITVRVVWTHVEELSAVIMSVLGKVFTLKQPESDRLLGLESASEYRERWISIRVIYYMGFVIYLAFGIVATSMWPYLKSVRRLLRHFNYSERA